MPDIEQDFTREINAEIKEYWETRSGQPYGPMTGEQINAELDAAVAQATGYPIPQRSPAMVYSFGFEAEDLLAVYGALRVYLRTLAGQESEDLEMLGRVVRLMNEIRPAAVKASKALSLAAVGVKE